MATKLLPLLESVTNSPSPPLTSTTNNNKPRNISSLPLQAQTHKPSKFPQLTIQQYTSLLDTSTNPIHAQQLHAHSLKSGIRNHPFLAAKFVNFYAKHGCFFEACLLFDEMPQRNLHAWTAILNAHLDKSLFYDSFVLFEQMVMQFGSFADLGFFVFPVAFKICGGIGSGELGRELHGVVIKCGVVSNVYVGNALINMYGKCGKLDDCRKVFELMPERDNVSWNSVITACVENGMVFEGAECLERMGGLDYFVPNVVTWSAVVGGFAKSGYDEEAVDMLFRMQVQGGIEPNARTLASVLPACARLGDIRLGKMLHGHVVRRELLGNSILVNGLMDVYRRCGDMESAFQMFVKYSTKNVVNYNTMIVGYCETGDVVKGKEIFYQMKVDGMERDVTSWNSLISGLVDNFQFREALVMYHDLLIEGIEPDSFTLGSALNVCANLVSLKRGKEIHSQAIVRGLQSDTFVGGALVAMYSKCQDLVSAEMVFNEVNERDASTWNALLACYARCNQADSIGNMMQRMEEDGFAPSTYTWNGILAGHSENGHLDLVMQLFIEMLASDLRPDNYTIGVILPACSRTASLERGKQVHAHSIRCEYDSDVNVGAALVDMYAKCGSVKYAMLAYNRISNPNLVAHNAMLTAFAMHGYGEKGIAFFQRILASGFKPDGVTFLSVLSSCVHAGSIETGHELFDLMGFYNVKPTLKHYTAMVDLLSRSGNLREAYDLIKKMPMEPDSVLWSTLLGSCVIHNNVELGEIAAKKLVELEPDNTANYVLLANLYAYSRRWSDLARIRQKIKDKGIQKSPGCSWIEDKEKTHVFLASDVSHIRSEAIYNTLDNLTLHIKSTTEML